jgi:6-phosphofructokinase 2
LLSLDMVVAPGLRTPQQSMVSDEAAAEPGVADGAGSPPPSIVTLTMNPAIDVTTNAARVVPDIKLRCESPSYEAGGGGINVARAIRRLGGDALALFPAGGPAGALLGQLLTGEDVRYRCLPVIGWTRQNVNVTEAATGRQFRFVMPGPVLAQREWHALLDVLDAFERPPRFLVASGSLPPGVPADFYARLARMARQRGFALVLDASGDPLRQAVAEGVYLLKPSLHEFEELTGSHGCEESRLVELGRRLVDDGRCEVLVLSLGERGVLWMSATEHGRLVPPAVSVKSSVGAGDSMVAGIVWSLTGGHTLADAVRFGVAAGAASVMNSGTELCRAGDVERLYTQVAALPSSR